MAEGTPDARTLTSWEEAFTCPIPTVRRIEQELRRDIVNSKERLRSLVGVKYRDLLNTADLIVQMNQEIQQAEDKLADIGIRCNTRLLERKSRNLQQVQRIQSEKGSENRQFTAQLTLLRTCISTVSSILRRHGSSLLAAKLLVLSRLLHKQLSLNGSAPSFIEHLRNRSVALGKRLLTRINGKLLSLNSTTNDIIEAMLAYCLANSSSCSDTLRHFHDVRLNALSVQLERFHPDHQRVMGALRSFRLTLQSTMDIFLGRLQERLNKLAARPLLEDVDLQKLGELRIELYRQWIGEDVKNFTLWIKHNDVLKSDAEKSAMAWSKEALGRFLAGLSKVLDSVHDLSNVLKLRKELLEEWLSVQSSTPTHSPLAVLDGVRDIVNGQLSTILYAQINGLTRLGLDISAIISDWNEDQFQGSALSLWDIDIMALEVSNGAEAFKEDVVNRTLGKDVNVLRVLRGYGTWLKSVEHHKVLIEDITNIRWEDLLEEEEDEGLVRNEVKVLKEDDLHYLRATYKTTLTKGFRTLQTSMHSASTNISGIRKAQQAAFLLRVIREIRRTAPEEAVEEIHLFAEDVVQKLHDVLADEIVSLLRPAALLANPTGISKSIPGRTLWEGDPQLPTQPSPGAFMLLRQLATSMELQGQDLWNYMAVAALKERVIKSIASVVTSLLKTDSWAREDVGEAIRSGNDLPNEGDGLDSQIAVTSDTRALALESNLCHDLQVQLLFDILYLCSALKMKNRSSTDNDEGLFSAIIEKVKKDLNLSSDACERLQRKSGEYWSRTRFLFGLLD